MKRAYAFVVLFLCAFVFLPVTGQAQGYRPGDIIGTNFGFVNRYRWTNDNGRVFAPNELFRLSDFDGKIVFFVFFEVW